MEATVARNGRMTVGRWDTRYPQRRIVLEDGRVTTHRLHRVVWEAEHGPIPKGMRIDHINNDGWDNRLENLRMVSHRQNLQNQPSAIGVCRAKSGKWRAYIKVGDIQVALGTFACYLDALGERRKAETKYRGEHAPTRK